MPENSSDSQSVIRGSNNFRVHNEFILPLFYQITYAPKGISSRQPIVFLPMCGNNWLNTIHQDQQRYHPDAKALHQPHHLGSLGALPPKQLVSSTGAIFVRNMIHQVLNGVRRLNAPRPEQSSFAHVASVQESTSQHLQYISFPFYFK